MFFLWAARSNRWYQCPEGLMLHDTLCCSFVYLHIMDCHHVLLSTVRHSLAFVPANHMKLSLLILDQLWDWRWSHLLGKNVLAWGLAHIYFPPSLILNQTLPKILRFACANKKNWYLNLFHIFFLHVSQI